jgi:F0F1-type ATP synthase membrane subunit b/b'
MLHVEHFDPWLGFWFPYINFIVFALLAYKFFKKPALAAPRKKREEFEKIMREATRARDEAQAKLDELDKRKAQIDSEIADMRSMAKQSAEDEAAKIVADAEQLATHLKTEAKRIADAEVVKARQTLQKEIVEAVRNNVVERVKAEMDSTAHLSMVKNQIGGLKGLAAES